MSTNDNANVNRPPSRNKTNISALTEALRADLLVNDNRLEDILKVVPDDTRLYDIVSKCL